MDGICGAALEKQGDQRAEGIQQKADDDQVDHQEDDGSAAHDCGCLRGGRGRFVKRFVR